MLVTPRIRMAGAADRIHPGEVLAIAGAIAAKHNHTFAGVVPRPPEPVALMIADRLGQPVFFSEEIDCPRLPVTIGEDRGRRALFWRKLVVNARDLPHHLLPAKFIGKMLRQWA